MFRKAVSGQYSYPPGIDSVAVTLIQRYLSQPIRRVVSPRFRLLALNPTQRLNGSSNEMRDHVWFSSEPPIQWDQIAKRMITGALAPNLQNGLTAYYPGTRTHTHSRSSTSHIQKLLQTCITTPLFKFLLMYKSFSTPSSYQYCKDFR